MARRSTSGKKVAEESASALEDFISSAEDLFDSLKDEPGAAVDRIRDKISASIERARDRLNELDMSDLASRGIDSTVGFVKRDPWRALAIAAVAALAISLIARGGSDDPEDESDD